MLSDLSPTSSQMVVSNGRRLLWGVGLRSFAQDVGFAMLSLKKNYRE